MHPLDAAPRVYLWAASRRTREVLSSILDRPLDERFRERADEAAGTRLISDLRRVGEVQTTGFDLSFRRRHQLAHDPIRHLHGVNLDEVLGQLDLGGRVGAFSGMPGEIGELGLQLERVGPAEHMQITAQLPNERRPSVSLAPPPGSEPLFDLADLVGWRQEAQVQTAVEAARSETSLELRDRGHGSGAERAPQRPHDGSVVLEGPVEDDLASVARAAGRETEKDTATDPAVAGQRSCDHDVSQWSK